MNCRDEHIRMCMESSFVSRSPQETDYHGLLTGNPYTPPVDTNIFASYNLLHSDWIYLLCNRHFCTYRFSQRLTRESYFVTLWSLSENQVIDVINLDDEQCLNYKITINNKKKVYCLYGDLRFRRVIKIILVWYEQSFDF